MPFKCGGQRLGPLGSIIVAEAILGAMREHPLQIASRSLDHTKSIKELVEIFQLMGANKDVVEALPDIKRMPDLLSFMRSRGVLP